MAIVAERVTVRIPDCFIADEKTQRWLLLPASDDAPYRSHKRTRFFLGHYEGATAHQLAIGEECDGEWVRSRPKARKRSVRRTISLDGASALGIQCGTVLEIKQRDEVVPVFSSGKFLRFVSANRSR